MRAVLGAVAALALFVVGQAHAQQGGSAPQATVDAAAATVAELGADPNYRDIADYIATAKAVMVIPKLLKAGLIVGGELGDAVVLSRTPAGWSGPAFYAVTGGSVGLQIGAEARQVIIAIMTEKGLNPHFPSELVS